MLPCRPVPATISALALLGVALALGSGCGSEPEPTARDAAAATPQARTPKGPKGAFLETSMTVTNKTSTEKELVLSADCISPGGLTPRPLKPGESTSARGWCTLSAADITGIFKWDCRPVHDCKSAYFTAGNPKVGWPWMVVDGQERGFAVGDRCSFTTLGQHFEAYRGPDRKFELLGAKDMNLTWVDATTLPPC